MDPSIAGCSSLRYLLPVLATVALILRCSGECAAARRASGAGFAVVAAASLGGTRQRRKRSHSAPQRLGQPAHKGSQVGGRAFLSGVNELLDEVAAHIARPS